MRQRLLIDLSAIGERMKNRNSTVASTDANAGRSDARALYAALDEQRRSRGISWQQVALEVGVSPSTLTRTKRGGRMEVDGMLAMVRWLGRTVESFTRGVTRKRQTDETHDPGSNAMAAKFRRIALSLEGADEGSHMGAPDFRVGGRIFATLASQHKGYGNLMLTPEQQADFVRELPEVFLPVHGGWGRMGATHIRLANATEDVLAGALRTAWSLRLEKNTGTKKKRSPGRG